ncbi:helix-turn-helix transcriptional regulator [Streptomyces sp. FIT100]|uniref:ArsR/SmtB family transcription factor n=1 Tax=Streptomyces sp. FIT100 TaxID=2837956 RepID=UPI002209FF6E|nr:metalloregulator ArsR/SmtB family transcription factor [Streptomyces sp. FIT100]UUN25058.1 winged helix-turn-helix domain-containing protein [Streptomyces sp. FIT100]
MTDAIWSALVDPHRRAVLDLLRDRDRAVSELVEVLGQSQPNVSKHLRVLREAGLVRVTKQGQQRIYAIEPGPIAELDAWLAPYRRLWNERLDLLGRYLDSAAADDTGAGATSSGRTSGRTSGSTSGSTSGRTSEPREHSDRTEHTERTERAEEPS